MTFVDPGGQIYFVQDRRRNDWLCEYKHFCWGARDDSENLG